MILAHLHRSLFTRVMRCSEAGVTTLAALALPVLIGSAGLAFDINRGYQQRIVNQRAADMAALGAALAFKASSEVSVLQPTAEDIARANNIDVTTVTASLKADTPNPGEQAVEVTVRSPVPYMLARVLGLSGNFDVVSSSLASLTAAKPSFAPPCFLALDSSTALDVGSSPFVTDGGTRIKSPKCSVAAVGSIYHDGSEITASDLISGSGSIQLAGGSDIFANSLHFAGEFVPPSYYPYGSEAMPPADKRVKHKVTLVDPWANDAELNGALSIFNPGNWPATTPAAIPAPTMNVGVDVKFEAWNPSPVPGATKPDSNTFKLPTGNYEFRNYEANGGTKVIFGDNSTISISGTFNPGGGIDFGNNSNVKVAGSMDLGWNNSMGNGSLHIGGNFTASNFTKGNGDLIVAGRTTINGTSSFGNGAFRTNALSLGGGTAFIFGDGPKVINGGIDGSGGGTKIEFGAGDIQIGKGNSGSMNGYAIKLGGSTMLFMGDGMFTADGHVQTAGGSRIVFGNTANHYINGNFDIAGAAIFGSGRYTINGWFKNGTGGASWPVTGPSGKVYGASVDGKNISNYEMVGFDVTFLTKDGYTLSGGTSAWIEASDTSVSGAQIGEMLFASKTTNKVEWGAGAASLMAGTTYFPNAVVEMSGGNSTTSRDDKCLTLIAKRIRAIGGAVAGTACSRMSDAIGGGGSGGGGIRLIG